MIVFAALFFYLVYAKNLTADAISGLLVCASNTWGLVMIMVALGYSFFEVPRSMWERANRPAFLKLLHQRAASVASEAETGKVCLRMCVCTCTYI